MSFNTLVIVLLVLFLLGGLPVWPYSREWGNGPSGAVGAVLFIIVLLYLARRLG